MISETGTELNVDGVAIEFQIVSGSEAPAEFTFYLPQYKAFGGAELVSRNMHNLYTLRGAKVRDARLWSAFIDEAKTRFSEAEIYLGSHHWPLWGQQNIQDFHNQGYYGTVSHNAKAVYQYYMGWFTANPAELNPLPESDSARRYVEMMGGAGKVLEKARLEFAAAGDMKATEGRFNIVTP